MLSEATAMKRSKRSIDEQAPVMRELQHRMANTLTILQANCRLDFARVADPELQESVRRHERRILQLAELHHFLSRGAGDGEIAAATYFRPLCGVLSRSILAPRNLHCEAFIGDGVLDASSCEWLGLIVAELVMNAAKHGFPDRAHGCVRIDIHAPDGMVWCCTVRDNGCGIKASRQGAGSRIVKDLVQLLRALMHVETGPTGTTVTIVLPIPVAEVQADFPMM